MTRTLEATTATYTRVAVGWDPSGSFFAVLVATPGDVLHEETPVKTLCGDTDDVTTVDGLRTLLAEHGIDLPDEIAADVERDQQRGGPRPLAHAWSTETDKRIPVWRSS